MHVFAWEKAARDLDKLTRVHFLGTGVLLAVSSWDPATTNDDGSTFNADGVALQLDAVAHGNLTSLVAVERVDHIEAWHFLSIDHLVARNQNFLGVVQLTNDEVRAESVVDCPLLLRHSPPREIHLLPWSAVSHGLAQLVVRLRALEGLFDVLTIVEVSKGSSCKAEAEGTVAQNLALLFGHPLDQSVSVLHVVSDVTLLVY